MSGMALSRPDRDCFRNIDENGRAGDAILPGAGILDGAEGGV
jgi:hypothetical protein